MVGVSDVTAVVLTYNRRQLLHEVLEALLSQDCGVPDILVVDNHSTDGTKEMLAPYLSRISYEDTGENLGAEMGFQVAIRWAVQRGRKRLWVMDDDCVPELSALSALLEADQKLNGHFGWLNSAVYWTNGELCEMNYPRKAYWKKITRLDEDLTPAAFASYVSLFLKTEVVRELGLNIGDFRFGVGDWELTRRISRQYPCYAVRNSKVVHKMAQNIKYDIVHDSADRLNRYGYIYRNEMVVMRREGVRGYIYFSLKVFYHTIRILLFSKGCRMEKLKTVFRSIQQGISYRPEIEYP